MKHTGLTQAWRVDHDMTIAYFIKAIALEGEVEEKDVLIMRGTHVPGAEECIITYLPLVQVYLLQKIDQSMNVNISQECIRAAILWQWAKKKCFTPLREVLAVPKGPPLVLGPRHEEDKNVLHCYLKTAHLPEEMYVVHVTTDASISDVLKNLEPITQYPSSSMLLVKEGVVISTREHVAVCNPMSYLLVGDHLHAVEICAAQAADWCDLWSLSSTTEGTSRGGGKTARTAPQPRAAIGRRTKSRGRLRG